MHFNFPSPNKDADNEKLTIRNVNTFLNKKPVAGNLIIYVTDLTPDKHGWTAQTLKRKVGETEFVDGQTVRFEKSTEPEGAYSVAEKIRKAYGTEIRESSED